MNQTNEQREQLTGADVIVSVFAPLGKHAVLFWVITAANGMLLAFLAPELRLLVLILFALACGGAILASFALVISIQEELRVVTELIDDIFDHLQQHTSDQTEYRATIPSQAQASAQAQPSAQAQASAQVYEPDTGVSIPFSDIFKEL